MNLNIDKSVILLNNKITNNNEEMLKMPDYSQLIAPSSKMQQSLIDTSSDMLMIIKILGLIRIFGFLLILVGLAVGILYIIKSKKTTGKKILIGSIIIIVPFILNLIFTIISLSMI